MKIFSFEPITKADCIVLILGTMPGEMSLRLNQYYGHGGNNFWKILFAICKEPFSKEYEIRKGILLSNKIALWDVLKACVREGSADKAILEEEANDFDTFLKEHPNIKLIAFNGKGAESYFKRFYINRPKVVYVTLPSTSSANTWKTFDEKLEEWKIITKIHT